MGVKQNLRNNEEDHTTKVVGIRKDYMKFKQFIKNIFVIFNLKLIREYLKEESLSRKIYLIMLYPQICILWWFYFMWKKPKSEGNGGLK